MFRFTMAAAVVVGVFAAIGSGQTPKVEAVGVREIRGADPSAVGFTSEPGLMVVLQVSGLHQRARYGTVIVSEAKDDAGTDLKPVARSSGQDEPTEFPAVTRHAGPNAVEEPPAFYARVKLESPARRARKITSLKGEIRVVAGGGDKPATVKIPAVKSLYGKTVSHPDLSRAGVTVQVAEQSQLDPLALSVMISGRTPRGVSVSVVDADGKRIFTGASGSGAAGTQCWTMTLERPLRDTDALNVTVPVGQKAVTVPFDLKDVELP